MQHLSASNLCDCRSVWLCNALCDSYTGFEKLHARKIWIGTLRGGFIYPVCAWQGGKIRSPQPDYSHPSLCKCLSWFHSPPAHIKYEIFFILLSWMRPYVIISIIKQSIYLHWRCGLCMGTPLHPGAWLATSECLDPPTKQINSHLYTTSIHPHPSLPLSIISIHITFCVRKEKLTLKILSVMCDGLEKNFHMVNMWHLLIIYIFLSCFLSPPFLEVSQSEGKQCFSF